MAMKIFSRPLFFGGIFFFGLAIVSAEAGRAKNELLDRGAAIFYHSANDFMAAFEFCQKRSLPIYPVKKCLKIYKERKDRERDSLTPTPPAE
jgi:hypothetical protein